MTGMMRLLYTLFIFMLLPVYGALAGSVVLEGKYQHKNIFVVNAIADDGVGFCVYEITINGEVSSDEVNSTAFEIDLSVYGMKLGDNVVIVIKHKDGCEPRILNPGALEPRPTFETASIQVDAAGMLTWETLNEQGKLPFIVQQYKWNKWVSVGEVTGKGTSVKNSYAFQTTPISGTNKFRVVQKGQEGGGDRVSPPAEYVASKAPVTQTFDKKTKSIKFSVETNYELYNEYGQIIKRGFGTGVDLSSMPKGFYYVSFDSLTEKVDRR